MTATYLQQQIALHERWPSAEDGEELLRTMVALPATHPSRASIRDEVIEAWLPLAHHLAARYSGRGEPFDDLLQTAIVGLIKAVDKFDPDRGTDFGAYAAPTIVGEIKRYFRDHTWDLRVPRRLQELRGAIREAEATLTQQLGRVPTTADLAADLDLSEDEVQEGIEVAYAYHTTSLQAPAATGDQAAELGELIGAEDGELELAELRVALGPALATLDQRQQRVLALRFFGNLTQAQIGEQVGVSQMHVSRLLARALATLQDELGPAL